MLAIWLYADSVILVFFLGSSCQSSPQEGGWKERRESGKHGICWSGTSVIRLMRFGSVECVRRGSLLRSCAQLNHYANHGFESILASKANRKPDVWLRQTSATLETALDSEEAARLP